jgi:ADP-heptose:LPS heptosyltransferase
MKMNEAKRHGVGSEPEQLAAEVLETFQSSGIYLRDHVARLVALATSEDRETSKQATGAFFTSLVESLADSFEPRAVSLYNRAFAQLIQHSREADRSGDFDRELQRFRLRDEHELTARAEALRQRQAPAWLPEASQQVQRIIVLSRVTLGADVAITSVMIERMKRACPRADITLVGARKAVELFGGDARLSFKEISYRRAGTTLERLLSWIDVLGCVRELTDELRLDQYLIADPDSRLTQLGLLPVSRAEEISNISARRSGGAQEQLQDNYLFFPSREYGSDTSHSLGQLTSAWLDDLFGVEELTYPHVSLASTDLEAASEIVKLIKREGGPVVSINFGVGENPLKRVGDDFEMRLVNELICDGGTIIFDKGAGEDETRRANQVISNAERISREGRAIRAIEINEENLKAVASSDEINADLIVWNGRIGMLAALISESDLYIGYDSAGQHIAAALGVPSIDVFAGFSSPRMLDRWRPTGKAEARVVVVDKRAVADTQTILSDVLRHAREMLKNIRQ